MKIAQCPGPGLTGTQFDEDSNRPVNERASVGVLGFLNTRRLVTILTNALSTNSEMPYGRPALTVRASQPRNR